LVFWFFGFLVLFFLFSHLTRTTRAGLCWKVESALTAGYRHVDCAPVYLNQPQVGAALTAALTAGLCTRDELFITSKLMTYDLSPDGFAEAVKQSLTELGVEYLDLLLLQWPLPQLAPIAEQWAAMVGGCMYKLNPVDPQLA
jgi:diketogulonate reductase-like aldo/keto reductase